MLRKTRNTYINFSSFSYNRREDPISKIHLFSSNVFKVNIPSHFYLIINSFHSCQFFNQNQSSQKKVTFEYSTKTSLIKLQ